MNNKGFAATGVLFIVLLLFLSMYISLLSMFSSRRQIYETIKDEIMNDNNITGRKYFLSTANIGEYVAYPIDYTNTSCVNSNNNTNAGWRILNIQDNVVTLVSSGTPECFNPSTFNDSGASSKQTINNLLLKYLDTNYADSVRSFNGGDFHNITKVNYSLCYNITSSECGNQNDLISTGSYYWLDNNYNTNSLYYWLPTEKKLTNGSNNSYGLRPVIVLKDAITYSRGLGTKTNPYRLIKP